MTRFFSFMTSILLLYFVYGFYLSQSSFEVIPTKLSSETSSDTYIYNGAINVHSDQSIGSSSYSQIINSAKNAELDYMIFTDLNMFSPANEINSYNGKLLTLSGNKYSYLDSRLIYFPLHKSNLGQNLGDVQLKLADLLTQKTGANKDSLVYLAHPYLDGFAWNGEIPDGLDGFEVANAKAISNNSWKESKISVLWSLFTYPFNPQLSFIRLYSEPEKEWSLFDKISIERKIVAYAGAEASARAIPLANYLIRFPSYQKSFQMFNNHLVLKSELTGIIDKDREKIFSALKNGRFFIAFDQLGDSNGFRAKIEDDNNTYEMGSEIKLSNSTTFHIKLPAEPRYFYEILIKRNGETVAIFNEPSAKFKIKQSGVYRAQVRVSLFLPLPDAKKWVTWIYTNPFWVN